jgi:CheY-like chemotaxis protein
MKILIIDDDSTELDLLDGSLDSCPGLQLVRASGPEAGLAALRALARSGAVPMALVDWTLGDTTAEGFIRAVRSDPALRHAIVLIFSSAPGLPVEEAYRSGATGFIVKPIGLEETGRLLASLASLCGALEPPLRSPGGVPS